MSASTTALAPPRFAELLPEHVEHVLADLGLPLDAVAGPGSEPRSQPFGAALFAFEASFVPRAQQITELARRAESLLDESGLLLLFLYGRRPERELAALRNALWPLFHVGALYELERTSTRKRTLHGSEPIEGGPEKASQGRSGVLVAARRTRAAMAPDTTVAKFDAAAAGWNGRPGTPGYAHFRWMRRFVADLARSSAGARVLDFGCGAGWVGIEAARRLRARELAAFDPSPEMVRLAEENARASGVASFRGHTGFGEAPPFPAPGEAPFDLVLSSGVISFSPDPERWLDGLAACVAPGGELVIGDIHRDSRGFRRRRAERALLPVRELNARTRSEVRAQLERRGFTHEASAGYQLTRPVPELMHLSETRLAGLLSPPLLLANRLAASASRAFHGAAEDCFDSWVMRLRKA